MVVYLLILTAEGVLRGKDLLCGTDGGNQAEMTRTNAFMMIRSDGMVTVSG